MIDVMPFFKFLFLAALLPAVAFAQDDTPSVQDAHHAKTPQRSAADCTAETGGVTGELCIDTDGTGVWYCPNTGDCSATTAWVRKDDTSGSGGTECSTSPCDLNVSTTLGGAAVQTGTDDDVPESGDFGAAADLDADGSVSAGAIDTSKLATGAKTVTVWQLAFDYGTAIDATQEWVLPSWSAATTITRCDCETYAGTSFTIDVCLGEDVGDDTCTTTIVNDLVCDAAGASSTGLSQAVSGRQELTTVVSAVAGSPTKGHVTCSGTLQ